MKAFTQFHNKFNHKHILCEKSGTNIYLSIEINVILTTALSLLVKIVSYFVFPDHIRSDCMIQGM